jgi:hypothetical protein
MADSDTPNDARSNSDAPRLQHTYGTINKEYAFSLATRAPEDDGPIYMVNLMKYHEIAQYDDGDGNTAVSGREADDQYNPSSILNKIGAAIVFVGDVVSNNVGTDDWDRIAVVRYPTRRSFIEMQSRKDFGEKHKHKAAGMLRTTLIACRPVDESLDQAERPTPRPAHSVVMVVHRTNNRDDVLRTLPTAQSLLAEGVVIGDGRSWDVVQFLSVAGEADIQHIAEQYLDADHSATYVLGLRATLNSFIG